MNDSKETGGSGEGQAGSERVDFQLPAGFESDETGKLVARARAGDVAALNDLFTLPHAHGRARAPQDRRALRMKEEPDDLAQTTFREATRDFANFEYRGESSLVRWLAQILQNKIRDKAEYYSAGKRDSGRERGMEVAVDNNADSLQTIEPPSKDLSVTMQVSRGENFEYLRKALEELTPEHRQAITLVFFEGRQLREAGEIMGGKTEDAVRMMLRRAEARLHEILKGSIGKGE
ncbi:MAG: sigma-70 family RNA polymerase sigma factor [Planctomycetes bacterium]|nr:sigma-70 family RNA polymerase sigma factor [Planctomycetota bacterium]